MKPIKYLLLFATALCVIQRGYYVSEPQRGFGPRFPRGSRSNSGFEHHQKPRFGRYQQDQDTYFQPQQQETYYRSNNHQVMNIFNLNNFNQWNIEVLFNLYNCLNNN